jgi:hypothetical protein
MFWALHEPQRLAARACGGATGACSVSFNVAASLSKTVISRATQKRRFISGRLTEPFAHALA